MKVGSEGVVKIGNREASKQASRQGSQSGSGGVLWAGFRDLGPAAGDKEITEA